MKRDPLDKVSAKADYSAAEKKSFTISIGSETIKKIIKWLRRKAK